MASLLSLSLDNFPVKQEPQPESSPVSSSPPGIVRPWELSPRKHTRTATTPDNQSNRPAYHSSSPSLHENTTAPLVIPSPIGHHMSPDLRYCSPSPNQDSGYHSNESSSYESSSPNSTPLTHRPRRSTRSLSNKAVELMENWYQQNFDHPYPSADIVAYIVKQGNVTAAQVRKWMANKRVRSYNTLSYNGTLHPKRLTRIQREISARQHARERHQARERHHPYSTVTSPMSPRIHATSTPLKTVPAPGVTPVYPLMPLPYYVPHFFPGLLPGVHM